MKKSCFHYILRIAKVTCWTSSLSSTSAQLLNYRVIMGLLTCTNVITVVCKCFKWRQLCSDPVQWLLFPATHFSWNVIWVENWNLSDSPKKKQKRNSSSHPISWDEFCGLTNGLTIFLPIFDIFCGNFHNTMPIIQLNVCIFCGERIRCAKKLCNGRESSIFLICQPIYFVCSKVNNTRTFVNHIFNSREIKKNYTHCSLISI